MRDKFDRDFRMIELEYGSCITVKFLTSGLYTSNDLDRSQSDSSCLEM